MAVARRINRRSFLGRVSGGILDLGAMGLVTGEARAQSGCTDSDTGPDADPSNNDRRCTRRSGCSDRDAGDPGGRGQHCNRNRAAPTRMPPTPAAAAATAARQPAAPIRMRPIRAAAGGIAAAIPAARTPTRRIPASMAAIAAGARAAPTATPDRTPTRLGTAATAKPGSRAAQNGGDNHGRMRFDPCANGGAGGCRARLRKGRGTALVRTHELLGLIDLCFFAQAQKLPEIPYARSWASNCGGHYSKRQLSQIKSAKAAACDWRRSDEATSAGSCEATGKRP